MSNPVKDVGLFLSMVLVVSLTISGVLYVKKIDDAYPYKVEIIESGNQVKIESLRCVALDDAGNWECVKWRK